MRTVTIVGLFIAVEVQGMFDIKCTSLHRLFKTRYCCNSIYFTVSNVI